MTMAEKFVNSGNKKAKLAYDILVYQIQKFVWTQNAVVHILYK